MLVCGGAPLACSELWDFDRLGNWAGDGAPGSAPTLPGYTLSGDINGSGSADPTTTRTHVVDQFNAIEQEITDIGSGTPPTQDFVYDASGNLVFDGLHWYRYDAWGRLCQVFPAGSLTANDFETGVPTYALKGRLKSTAPTIDPEDSIVHLTYDALGRLIAKQSPWPLVSGEIRTEIYLHDGVRRIQEIWREPAQGNGAQGGQNQNNQGPTVYVDSTEREYVHSPGYVDEFVCEIETGGTPDTFWWVLQDPNYNVVALVSDGDGAGGMGSGGTYRGEVARQYSWSPYGQLLRADIYDTSAPMSRLGHQGLFHDRLDADILTEPMVAFARQAVQNRNRTLLPWLGRFAQQDPNGWGSPFLSAEAKFAQLPRNAHLKPEPEAGFANGMNLHCYALANPGTNTDPLGLFVPGPGDFITGVLEAVISTYSANQEWDSEWASDWELPDNLHSRLDDSWIDLAMMQGLYDAFWIGIPGTDIGFNPLDAFAGSRRGSMIGPFGGRMARLTGKMTIEGFQVLFYQHPGYIHPFVRFSPDAWKKQTRRVRVSGNSFVDNAAANALYGKPAKYRWEREYGEPYVWHHDDRKDLLLLIPLRLHRAVLPHTGGAAVRRGQ